MSQYRICWSSNCGLALLMFSLVIGGCAPRSTTITTEVSGGQSGGKATQTTQIDGQTIASVKTEWQNEFLEAEGTAPVIKKYNDPPRDQGLAKLGARTDAERKLARMISDVKISESVTMRDLETSDYVKSEVQAVLRGVEVMNERYDERDGMYHVQVRMPKLALLRCVEAYQQPR
jgi:hypothetical protein